MPTDKDRLRNSPSPHRRGQSARILVPNNPDSQPGRRRQPTGIKPEGGVLPGDENEEDMSATASG
jgi:hypothetical protein